MAQQAFESPQNEFLITESAEATVIPFPQPEAPEAPKQLTVTEAMLAWNKRNIAAGFGLVTIAEYHRDEGGIYINKFDNKVYLRDPRGTEL